MNEPKPLSHTLGALAVMLFILFTTAFSLRAGWIFAERFMR
jgi:hypothetical protein